MILYILHLHDNVLKIDPSPFNMIRLLIYLGSIFKGKINKQFTFLYLKGLN